MNINEYNTELVNKYPFLLPRNVFTGKPPENYDYSWTSLDDMPDGWRAAFGEEMCEKIKQILVETWEQDNMDERKAEKFAEYYGHPEGMPIDYLHVWRINQIKEKYGSLRVYPNFFARGMFEVLNEYEKRSTHTCIKCGKPATWISLCWISPWCDEHKEELRGKEHFMAIDEYFKEFEEESEDGVD